MDTEVRPVDARPTPAAPPRTVTFRAVALGLLLLPVNAYWVVMMENIRYSAHPTTVSLFFNVVFILVVLSGLNGLVARVRPRWALCQGELLLIYAMLCLGTCMAGHDFAQMLVANLTWPFAQADTANGYTPLFARFLPKWAMVSDIDATKGFYYGNSTLYTRQHIGAWLPAVLVWTSFVAVLLWTMQCLNVLIRKRWMDDERLTFPLTRIPLEITDAQPGGRGRTGKALAKQPLFWLGFAVAATGDLFNTLHAFYPGVPSIGTGGMYGGQAFVDFGTVFTSKPWSAVSWTPVTYYPFVLGLGMLMPLDFLFSSWFFYIMWKLQAVWIVAEAWDGDARMPYANYQAFGAYALFLVSTLWLSRPYFRQVWACVRGLPSEIDDSDEPLRYKWAILGAIGGVVALTAFSAALGLVWWLGIAFFLIYFGLALAITRMRAELGTPVHDLHWTGPDWTLSDVLGSQALAPQTLAVFSLFYWFNRAYRCHPMPFGLEAFKMAEQTGARREMRGWFWTLLLAGTFGMLCACWAMLHGSYIDGMKWHDTTGWDRYTGWLKQPLPPNKSVIGAIGVGFVFAALLQAMRVRFYWWPFHPLAYAVSGSWEMNLLWGPLLLAWAIKSALLRWGGVGVYQNSLPFFYGLILGQFIPGSVLNIWGIITHTPTFQFWQ